MITGVFPNKHGIYNNSEFDYTGKRTGEWFYNYDSIRCETLWTAMHKKGWKTAGVRWPVTVNAPIDFNIPDYPGYKNSVEIPTAVKPAALWKELQDSATGYLNFDGLNDKDDQLTLDENSARQSAYIFKKYQPNFMAVHFYCTDHNQHRYGKTSYKTRAAVSGVDRSIKTIIEAIQNAGLKDSTVVIVTGDHGFEDVYRQFNPNVLLKKAGLLEDVKTGKWKAVFHTAGGSAFLKLKKPGDKETAKKVMELLQAQPDSVKQYFSILTEADLKKWGADSFSAFGLTGLLGTTFGGDLKELIKPLDKVIGVHGYSPAYKNMKTGFVAYGPGVKKGVVVENMRLLDITPLIAHLMGVEMPKGDGELRKEIME